MWDNELNLFLKIPQEQERPLPTINYKHEKRQKELDKKKKKEQKIKKKQSKKENPPAESPVKTVQE